ncbi:MAG: response regulator transcription factor [Ignavibacteriaceae bacterium]
MKDRILRVVIIEDDDLIRNVYADLISDSSEIICTGAYSNCEDAIKNLAEDAPDIILMDIGLPGISGIEGTRRIKRAVSSVDIIVITVNEEDEQVFEALCAGASGYLTKNTPPDKIIGAILEVASGGAPMSTNIARKVIESFRRLPTSPLTPRETELLQLMCKGKSYSMIANELFINKETVRTHIKNIYQKLNLNSRAAAIEKEDKERLL